MGNQRTDTKCEICGKTFPKFKGPSTLNICVPCKNIRMRLYNRVKQAERGDNPDTIAKMQKLYSDFIEGK